MICKKCGKEIPDDAKFCGFCGAVVETEENSTPVEETKVEEPVEEPKTEEPVETPVEENKTEEPVETPVEEEKTEEPVETPIEENKTEEPVETTTEEKAPESIEEKVEDGIKNSAAGKMLLGDDGKLDKEDFTRVMNGAKDGIKSAVESVAWEDEFTLLLDVIKNPFGDISLTLAPTIAIALFTTIVNSCAFSHVLNGIVLTALIYAGYILVQFIEKDEPKLDWKKAFAKASQYIFVPSIAMLLTVIISAFGGGLMSSFGGIGLGVILSLFLMLFSFILYIVSMTKLVKKMNDYIFVLIISVILCLAAWFIFNNLMNILLGAATSWY